MKIGNIVSPNEKGQIVIPKEIRKAMGITSNSFLQLLYTGNSIILNPVRAVLTVRDVENSYLDILKKTAGKWKMEDWAGIREKRTKIELAASKKNKQTW